MLPQEIIRTKRNGEALSREDLEAFFQGYQDGVVTDYQMSAFLMACYFHGLNREETLTAVRLFIESGDKMDLSRVPGVKVEKHSTGGVGDKVSLLLAPIVSAAGVRVPMISGRGLGHTGGTLDKLESIPGFRTDLTAVEFIDVLERCGAAMAGQTDRFVPLDRRIYALRDVTATVEVDGLIGASIMSKKIASGADALVLDIKTGGGAFMPDEQRGRELAELLTAIGREFGLHTLGFLTDMSEPLGFAVGNWLEVVEVCDCLQGRESKDLMEVTYVLAAAMIQLGRKAASVEEGTRIARDVVRSGLAFEQFVRFVEAQGGDGAVIRDTLRYRIPTHAAEVHAPQSGYVHGIDARAIGLAATALGAGRARADQQIDPTAGIVFEKKSGAIVEEGDCLCRVYSSTIEDLYEIRNDVQAAFSIGASEPRLRPKVHGFFDEDGYRAWPSAAPAVG